MLSEREVQILFDTSSGIVEDARDEVTIDRHVAEADITAQALARVLEIPYQAPKRTH